MIYLQYGTNTNTLTPVETSAELSPFNWLLKYKPQQFNATTLDAMAKIKAQEAAYFIAGTNSGLKRSDQALQSRSLLVLDYDAAPPDFIQLLSNKLPSIEWLVYPSINNRLKGNAPRWRLVLNLDRAYFKSEHASLIAALNFRLGIKTDASAKQWSQVMGLPVVTPHNRLNDIVHHPGQSFSVDGLLEYAKTVQSKPVNQFIKTSAIDHTADASTHRKKWTGKLLDSIVNGAPDGNRNNHLTKIAGSLFYSDADPETVYNLLLFANDMLSDPLDQEEVNKIFRSILKKEVKKY